MKYFVEYIKNLWYNQKGITMRIAICEDEAELCEKYKKTFEEYLTGQNLSFKIDCFKTGKSFKCVSREYDIVFLDYMLPDVNGMQIAQDLRDENSSICIVFLTAYPDQVYNSFRVNTFRYLIKPVAKVNLLEALESFIKVYQTNKKLIIPNHDNTYSVNMDEIIYIEADKKGTVVRTTEKTFFSTKSISAFEAEIRNPLFIRTHRSYIVNMKHVQEFDKRTISLSNGEKAALSSKSNDIFIRSYMNYLKYSI